MPRERGIDRIASGGREQRRSRPVHVLFDQRDRSRLHGRRNNRKMVAIELGGKLARLVDLLDRRLVLDRSMSALVNASTSSGLRLVTIFPSITAGSSTTVAPALRRSVRIDGQLVAVRSRTRSASISSQGPWQMAPTGFPCSANRRISAITSP